MKPVRTSFTSHFCILLLLSVFSGSGLMAQVVTSSNLALNKGASASSSERADLNADKAFDGNNSTRFSSAYSDNEWIAIDLGKPYFISQVVLTWEKDYGKDFNILFSADGTFRDLIKDSIQIRNNVLTDSMVAGTNSINMKSNTVARYVRMQGIHRATANGYSLYEFQVAGATSLSGALPVTVTGFTAVPQGAVNLLEWTTTTENNNAGFYVERSSDGIKFTSIGWVAGLNGGTVTSRYSFTDKQTLKGKNYYRLNITDLNGKSVYSSAVSAIAASTEMVRSYPVPAKDHITVEYQGTTGEKVRVSLLNAVGKPVYDYTLAVRSSQQTITINRTAGMQPGIYFLSVQSTANGQHSTQIVLQ